VAVNYIALSRTSKHLLKRAANKLGFARFLGKMFELFFREIRFAVITKGHVKNAFAVIATQAVVAVAVHI
ncbi:hypothetical protein SB758_41010, partial [Burkholderia sp. SIMBA_013]